MDRNFLLALALSFGVVVAWAYLVKPPPHPESEAPAPAAAEQSAEPATPAPAPQAEAPAAEEGAGAFPPTAPGAAPAPGAAAVAEAPAPEPAVPEQTARFESDLVDVVLSSRGGGIKAWELRRYHDVHAPGEPPVELAAAPPALGPALATPFDELGHGDWSRAAWQLEQPEPNTVVFTRRDRGVVARKTFEFDPARYVVRLRVEVENGTDRFLRPTFRVRWPASTRPGNDFQELSLAAYQEGDLIQAPVVARRGFLGMGGGAFDEARTLEREVDWAGMNTRYFIAAVMPDVPRDAFARFVPVAPGELAATELAFAPVDVPPGQRAEREYRAYVGPKEADRLDEAGAHLAEAIQRGWFPPLTRFFSRLLHATYEVVPNYGVAIILLTIVVRLLMAPIMARQMKSMKRMGEMQPKIKAIQEQYPDDRQKQSEAMMAAYREAGVSPFSMMTGCLPMLLQLPVFIGFYFALQGSIDLRQQPFVGWIQDLSAPESLFMLPGLDIPVRLLPLLMGGSMVLQQRLSPTAMDPAQARMMMVMMPVMFTVLFYQFASGLVLYWLVSNLLGIAQQLYTNRSKNA